MAGPQVLDQVVGAQVLDQVTGIQGWWIKWQEFR